MSHGHFRYNQLFSISLCNIMHVVFQLLQRSMPERIIRQPDYFKIFTALHKLVKPLSVKRIVAAIIQMQHNRKRRIHAAHRTDSRIQETRHIIIIRIFPIWPQ